MQIFRCDGCGKEIKKGALHYTVKIEVKAAYDELEIRLADLVRDHRAELIRLIEQMEQKSPEEIEESVYSHFNLDLCPACHRAYIKNPLRFHPEEGGPQTGFDVDGFLKSLGYGPRDEKHDG